MSDLTPIAYLDADGDIWTRDPKKPHLWTCPKFLGSPIELDGANYHCGPLHELVIGDLYQSEPSNDYNVLISGTITITRLLTEDGDDIVNTTTAGDAAEHLITALGMLELAKLDIIEEAGSDNE